MVVQSEATDKPSSRGTRMRTAFVASTVIHVAVLTVALAWWTTPDPIEVPPTQGIAVDLVPPPEQTAEKTPEEKKTEPQRDPILVPPKFSSTSLASPPPQQAPAPPPPKVETVPPKPPEPAQAKPPESDPQTAPLKPIAPEWTDTPGETPPGEAAANQAPPPAVQEEPLLPKPEVVEQMSRLNRPGEFDAVAEVNARLTAEEIAAFRAQIQKCWVRPPALSAAPPRLQATVRVSFRNNGGLRGEPMLIQAPASALGPALVKAAITAVQQCQPYTALPRAKFVEWQVLDLRFTPDGPSGM